MTCFEIFFSVSFRKKNCFFFCFFRAGPCATSACPSTTGATTTLDRRTRSRLVSYKKSFCQFLGNYVSPPYFFRQQFNLEVWPGYVAVADVFEGGLLLQVDVAHRRVSPAYFFKKLKLNNICIISGSCAPRPSWTCLGSSCGGQGLSP